MTENGAEEDHMPSKLKQYLNRSILVSIPALFEDGKCRAYTLQSIEADGLWLSSAEMTARLLPENDRKVSQQARPVFVPVTQITAIILPGVTAPAVQSGETAASNAAAGAVEAGAAQQTAIPTHAASGAASQAAPPTDATATGRT
jgi:hypothetical protein